MQKMIFLGKTKQLLWFSNDENLKLKNVSLISKKSSFLLKRTVFRC